MDKLAELSAVANNIGPPLEMSHGMLVVTVVVGECGLEHIVQPESVGSALGKRPQIFRIAESCMKKEGFCFLKLVAVFFLYKYTIIIG
jgi:hypothetical protein